MREPNKQPKGDGAAPANMLQVARYVARQLRAALEKDLCAYLGAANAAAEEVK